MDNNVIASYKVYADRKVFFIDLEENERGKLVKLSEKVGSHRDRILVPVEALDELIEALGKIKQEV